MRPRATGRWEAQRARGFWPFVLSWGVLRFGGAMFVIGLAIGGEQLFHMRRLLEEGGVARSLWPSGFLAVVPGLAAITFGGGMLWGIVMWCCAEWQYRRAQKGGARA